MPTPTNKVTSEIANQKIIDFLTSADLDDLAAIYSRYIVDGPAVVTECVGYPPSESDVFMNGERHGPYPYRNAEGSIFWTGLPCGEDNDLVCQTGTDYIVYTLNDDPGETHVFVEANPDSHFRTQEFLEKTDWNDWLRVRALTPEDAKQRYWDAQDQWRYFTNGYDRTPEGLTQDLVKLKPEERPEVPDLYYVCEDGEGRYCIEAIGNRPCAGAVVWGPGVLKDAERELERQITLMG